MWGELTMSAHPCSPGHAGREGPQLARTGASQGFPRAAAPVGVFSRGTSRISAPASPALAGRLFTIETSGNPNMS